MTFLLHAPEAAQAAVTGSFVHWDRRAMRRDARGVWSLETVVPLDGSYDYKFLVDSRWALDPSNPERGHDPSGYLNSRFQIYTSAAAEERLRRLTAALRVAPPLSGDAAARARAALDLDDLARSHLASHAHALREWYLGRLLDACDRLGARRGRLLTQLYGHGVVWTEAGVNVAVDAVTARGIFHLYWHVPPEVFDALAASIDILLVSHGHPDHLDEPLLRRVLARGGAVAAPAEIADRLPSGVRAVAPGEAFEIRGFRVRAHEGRHVYGEGLGIPLRYYEVVSPDGARLLHTSDHDYTAGLAREAAPDVLVPKGGGVSPTIGGAAALRDLARVVRPRMIFPGHMNEVGHPVGAGREPYAVALEGLRDHADPWAVLLWGETAVLP